MVIYLRHPVHGTKVAISDLEAKADEKNGWIRYTLEAQHDQEVVSNTLRLKRPYNKRQA